MIYNVLSYSKHFSSSSSLSSMSLTCISELALTWCFFIWLWFGKVLYSVSVLSSTRSILITFDFLISSLILCFLEVTFSWSVLRIQNCLCLWFSFDSQVGSPNYIFHLPFAYYVSASSFYQFPGFVFMRRTLVEPDCLLGRWDSPACHLVSGGSFRALCLSIVQLIS